MLHNLTLSVVTPCRKEVHFTKIHNKDAVTIKGLEHLEMPYSASDLRALAAAFRGVATMLEGKEE